MSVFAVQQSESAIHTYIYIYPFPLEPPSYPTIPPLGNWKWSLGCVWLFATPWTVALQAPLAIGTEPGSPALQADSKVWATSGSLSHLSRPSLASCAYSSFPLTSCFTHGSVDMSMLLFQFFPPSPSLIVSPSPISTSMSAFLPCRFLSWTVQRIGKLGCTVFSKNKPKIQKCSALNNLLLHLFFIWIFRSTPLPTAFVLMSESLYVLCKWWQLAKQCGSLVKTQTWAVAVGVSGLWLDP